MKLSQEDIGTQNNLLEDSDEVRGTTRKILIKTKLDAGHFFVSKNQAQK